MIKYTFRKIFILAINSYTMRKSTNPTPEIPENLIEAILSGTCVLFAGSGISRCKVLTETGVKEQFLPTWKNLLIYLTDKALELKYITKKQYKDLKKAAKDGKYLFVAETIRRKLGEREFSIILDSIFRFPPLYSTEIHKIISEIPFSAIITTNYDKLIKRLTVLLITIFHPCIRLIMPQML